MRQPVYLYLFFILLSFAATAQKPLFGNEWINYQQTYYKIPVAQKGLYRITVSDLQKAGLPLASLDPKTLQLFHRGVEQSIIVEGEADGKFDAADYIEFLGRGNDGMQDSVLYRPASAQPHSYYSLFSDTTAYFLTARLDAKPGKRMVTYTDADYTGLVPELYHWEEELRLFTETYPGWAAGIPNKIEYSHFEEGEGYTGSMQQNDRFYDNQFMLNKAVRTGPAPQLEGLLVGREAGNHQVDFHVGAAIESRRLVNSLVFPLFTNERLQQNLTWTDVGTEGRLVVSTISTGAVNDRYSVSYLRLRYPQKLSANGQAYKTYQLAPNLVRRSLLDVTEVPANTRFWDISDPNSPVLVGATSPSGSSARLVVRGTEQARTVVSASQPITGLTPRRVQFMSWENRRPTYLLIAHEALMQSVGDVPNAVQAYAAYRASNAGGRYDTLTVTMQQLFDQFSYGERHPMAITRFADQLLQRSKGSAARPQYMLLLGRARSTPGIRRNPRQATLDMVLTYGFPGSDAIFTAGLDGIAPNVPAIPTGRINAGTPQEVINYLRKVQEHEALPGSVPWRKNVLHLSGGSSPYEVSLLRALIDRYRDKVELAGVGARVTTMSKQTDNPVEQLNVVKQVNEGAGLVTFFGHSSLNVTDLDIGLCSDDALGYQNKGKYPMLLINGCASGNFFYGSPTLAADWVLTPNRGAIAAIAQSHLGFVNTLDRYATEFYGLLADSTQLYRSIGQLQQETIRRVLMQAADGSDLANTQQMVLQGDPAVHLFPFRTADYS
ncbi:MAG TPA: C25 family cysteine peptidase, partial [Fibrella sp.]